LCSVLCSSLLLLLFSRVATFQTQRQLSDISAAAAKSTREKNYHHHHHHEPFRQSIEDEERENELHLTDLDDSRTENEQEPEPECEAEHEQKQATKLNRRGRTIKGLSRNVLPRAQWFE